MLKIGMLTSGGDCQGLNAALRGVAKTLYNELGDKVTIYGIRDGYRGLIEGDYHEMLPEDFSDILTVGGTILGTSRQPFKEMRKTIEDSEETKLDKMLHTVKKAGFDCLVITGRQRHAQDRKPAEHEGCKRGNAAQDDRQRSVGHRADIWFSVRD